MANHDLVSKTGRRTSSPGGQVDQALPAFCNG